MLREPENLPAHIQIQELANDFVTVSEAAQRLQTNERTVRRHALKLSDSDRQVSDEGPLRVRLSAIAQRLGKPLLSEEATGDVFDTDRRMSDSAGQSDRRVSDTEREETETGATWRERAVVAEARAQLLESERDTLRSALQREQENASAALARLAEAEERSKVLIAAAATGRILPAPESSPGASGDTETGASEQSGQIRRDGRPWWQFWSKE